MSLHSISKVHGVMQHKLWLINEWDWKIQNEAFSLIKFFCVRSIRVEELLKSKLNYLEQRRCRICSFRAYYTSEWVNLKMNSLKFSIWDPSIRMIACYLFSSFENVNEDELWQKMNRLFNMPQTEIFPLRWK